MIGRLFPVGYTVKGVWELLHPSSVTVSLSSPSEAQLNQPLAGRPARAPR
jgi:hypothetical protein